MRAVKLDNKRESIWGAAAICSLLIVAGCQRATNPAAPQVNGKTLTQWADEAAAPLEPDRFADIHHRELRASEQRRQAFNNIEMFGAAAIPVLLDLRQNGDLGLRDDSSRILSRIGARISTEAESVIPLLASIGEQTASAESKRWADAVLRDIGSGTTPVDAMINPLYDRGLRSAVVVDLAKADWWINDMSFSKKPVDALRDIANATTSRASSDKAYTDVAKLHEQVTSTKLHVIDNFETKRLPPVAELIEKASQPQTMLYSLQSLEHYAKARAAVPDIDLGSLVPDLSGAIPVLIEIAKGGHRRFATQSLRILGLIGPEASDAVPLAIELLESDFYDLRAESAAALGGFGVGSREVVEALVASVDRDSTTNQRIASQHRPGSRQGRGLRPQLPPGTLRANVAISLGKLAAHPDLAVPTLVKMLDLRYMGSSEGCDSAATALAEFGEKAKIAIPDLVDRLRSRPSSQTAITALRRIDPGLSETVQQLIEKLSSDDEDIQLRSILVLALLRENGAPASTPLQRIVDGDDETMAAWAAYALWKIDPERYSLRPAFPVLIEILENPKPLHLNKLGVLSDLASIGAEAMPAVPAIRKAIERGDFGRSGDVFLRRIESDLSDTVDQ